MNDYLYKNTPISEFLSKTTLNSGDYLTVVSQGQNYKITLEDFLLVLGAVGTLDQLGEVTGTPILFKDGANNYIRNFINGSGIISSLTVEGGMKVSHNFSQGDGGQPVLIDPEETSPIIANLVPGDGVSIARSGSNLVISTSGVPVASNVVIVNEMSDFPAPVGGVITLGDDSAYLVSANLTTPNRFVMGDGTVVQGADSAVASLNYTGTGDMFTQTSPDSDGSKVTRLTLNCATGTLVNVTGSGSGLFQLVNCTIGSAASLGTISNLTAVQVTDCAFFGLSDGFLFTGSMEYFVGVRNLFVISTGVLFDLNACSFSAGFSLETCYIQLSGGATFLKGLADSGNMLVGATGSIFNNRILNTASTILDTVSETDQRWEFLLNDEIPNSITSLLAIKDSTTITISAINTPVIIGATWISDHESRFESTSGGRFTYTGKGGHVNIQATVSAVGVAVQSRDFEFLIYKNGVAVPNAVFARSFSNAGDGSVSIVWQEDLVTGDYLELWVQNTESADDITINSVTLAISG